MKTRIIFLLFFISLSCSNFGIAQVDSPKMSNQKMEEILKGEVDQIEGRSGAWQFVYGGHVVLILTDEAANRMRIFSPIVEEKDIGEEQMKAMLEANFHSALDAKYCLYDGFVVSVFTHPLEELSDQQLIDAARQVVNLAATFGTTYQSTDFIFAPRLKESEQKVNQKPKKKS